MSGGDGCGCGPNVCGPMSLQHDWKIVQLLNGNQAALGRPSTVDFKAIDAMVDGRYVHAAAIKLVFQLQLTNAAGAAADAVIRDHALRSMVYDISLSDRPNWKFLDKIDGRDVYEADWFRFGRYIARVKSNPRTVGHGAGATVALATVEIMIDLTRPDGDPERFIPISSLQAMGMDAFRFTFRDDLNTVIRGIINAASTCHATGLFQMDGTTPGCEIYYSHVELPASNHPPRWALRSDQYDGTEGHLGHVDATHTFAVHRDRVEDHAVDGTYTAGGETAPGLLDGATYKVGGREVLSILQSKAARWSLRDLFMQSENRSSFASLSDVFGGYGFPNVALAESVGTPGFRMILPPTDRKVAPAGRIGYRIETLPLGKFRVLHEFTKCGGDDDVAEAAKNAGIKTFTRAKLGPTGVQLTNNVQTAKAIDPTGATLIIPDTKVS